MGFTQKIIAAMVAGIVVGVLLGAVGSGTALVDDWLVGGLFEIVGRIFIALLQMMVVPLVLVSLVCGVTSLGDMRALGRLGAKTLGLYLVTTAAALVLALTLALLVSPGEGFELAGNVEFESREAPPLTEVLIDMVPSNPIRALAEGEMLQIIVFALLLGFAISVSGEAGRRVAGVFHDLNDVVMRMVLLVIKTAPIGVFALIARTFATQGLDAFRPLASYFLVVAAGLVLHVALTYTLLLRLGGLNPIPFFAKMKAVMTFAFSTSSSSATIPVTLNTLERRHGVGNSIAAFTVPLGATINMDGTAIMQGVATVFIANVYGVDLGLGDYLTVVLTATLASIGTAAVPSAGLIMLAMVLQQVGLPVQGIALIIGVDRLLDMLRTAVNVTGDSAVTCVIARSENALDQKLFDDRHVTIEETQDVRRVAPEL
ncbi:MAG: dicarboxylate/amino acid:cation symporter [Gammaproteobacteria bacterium]|nr:dicarboxylate/amino acid:cation symporter [Gammaproteobacteria bacterium]